MLMNRNECYIELLFVFLEHHHIQSPSLNTSGVVIKDSDKELSGIRPEVSGFSVKELGISMADVNRDNNYLDLTLSSPGNIESPPS